jgi:hypothetical protein
MEHLEALHDLAKRTDAAMEDVRNLLDRLADIPLGTGPLGRQGLGIADDLRRAGRYPRDAEDEARRIGRVISHALELAGRTKGEIEYLRDRVDELIGETGRLV